MSVFDGPRYTITSTVIRGWQGGHYDSWVAMARIPEHRLENLRKEYAEKWNCKPEQIIIESK